MKRNLLLASLVTVVLPSAWLLAQPEAHEAEAAHANFYPPADIEWKDGRVTNHRIAASVPRTVKVRVNGTSQTIRAERVAEQ